MYIDLYVCTCESWLEDECPIDSLEWRSSLSASQAPSIVVRSQLKLIATCVQVGVVNAIITELS